MQMFSHAGGKRKVIQFKSVSQSMGRGRVAQRTSGVRAEQAEIVERVIAALKEGAKVHAEERVMGAVLVRHGTGLAGVSARATRHAVDQWV